MLFKSELRPQDGERQIFSPKRWYPTTSLHNVITRMTATVI